MTTRIKPDFSAGAGIWIDPDFLPRGVRENLTLHLLESPLTADQKDSLILFCNDAAQELDEVAVPAAQQIEEIERIRASAHRLMISLEALKQPSLDALNMHADWLAFGSQPPVQLSENVFTVIRKPGRSLPGEVWDWAEAAEACASLTLSRYRVSRQTKPAQQRARGYLARVAQHVVELTGKTPPKTREGWFCAFAGELCNYLGLPGGSRIVGSAIDASTR